MTTITNSFYQQGRPGFEVPTPEIFGKPIKMRGLIRLDAKQVLIIHTNPGGYGMKNLLRISYFNTKHKTSIKFYQILDFNF